jgi:hypothetical protein
MVSNTRTGQVDDRLRPGKGGKVDSARLGIPLDLVGIRGGAADEAKDPVALRAQRGY